MQLTNSVDSMRRIQPQRFAKPQIIYQLTVWRIKIGGWGRRTCQLSFACTEYDESFCVSLGADREFECLWTWAGFDVGEDGGEASKSACLNVLGSRRQLLKKGIKMNR